MCRAALLLALIFATPAFAADPAAVSMDVAPTTLELVPGEPGLFYVANHGAAPVEVRLDGFDWSQPNGDDALAPSDDLVVSPGEATIAPGARQLVRVLAPDTKGERCFRLMVSQLPSAVPEPGNAVRILLRFGVPVFAGGGSGNLPPVLAWSLSQHGHVSLVTARNRGSRAVKLTGVVLRGANGASAKPDDDRFIYVLPGAAHSFAFSHAPEGMGLGIAAHDARSGLDVEAALAPRP
jgi:fimbrial chaperone protein